MFKNESTLLFFERIIIFIVTLSLFTTSTILTPTSTFTPTPTSITKPVSHQTQTTPTKQYGGWYWQSQLNHAQMWVGTDSVGRDIWVDHPPTPTPIPTHKYTTQKQLSTQGNTSGNFSETEIKVNLQSNNKVGTINYSQSCSMDGNNSSIPKCP